MASFTCRFSSAPSTLRTQELCPVLFLESVGRSHGGDEIIGDGNGFDGNGNG